MATFFILIRENDYFIIGDLFSVMDNEFEFSIAKKTFIELIDTWQKYSRLQAEEITLIHDNASFRITSVKEPEPPSKPHKIKWWPF